MSTYYVIREGKVKGQGRYWSVGVPWVTNRDMATRYGRNQAESLVGHGQRCRLVRVTRKPHVESMPSVDIAHMASQLAEIRTLFKSCMSDRDALRAAVKRLQGETVTLDHHLASVKQAREAALEEASAALQALLDVGDVAFDERATVVGRCCGLTCLDCTLRSDPRFSQYRYKADERIIRYATDAIAALRSK